MISQKNRSQTLKLRTAQALSLRLLRHRQLSRKNKTTVLLGGLIVMLGCVPVMFSKTKIVDAHLTVSVPMTAWTYAYLVCGCVQWVIGAVIMVRSVHVSIKPFFKLYLSYCIYDLILFFVNYNSVNYYFVPLIIFSIICNKIYS